MEKSTPHYRLDDIKSVVAVRGPKAFTITALWGVDALEISEAEAIGMVLALQAHNFYKSMTTHADHRVWQDVYHARCPNGRVARACSCHFRSRVVHPRGWMQGAGAQQCSMPCKRLQRRRRPLGGATRREGQFWPAPRRCAPCMGGKPMLRRAP